MTIPILVLIVGLVLYFAFSVREPKVAECGRIMFFSGLLVTLFSVAGTRVF